MKLCVLLWWLVYISVQEQLCPASPEDDKYCSLIGPTQDLKYFCLLIGKNILLEVVITFAATS